MAIAQNTQPVAAFGIWVVGFSHTLRRVQKLIAFTHTRTQNETNRRKKVKKKKKITQTTFVVIFFWFMTIGQP